MKKNIYVKPQIDVVCMTMEQECMLNTASMPVSETNASPLDDGTYGYSKSNDGGLWDFDDEEQ